MSAAIGLTLLACAGVACWFAGSETRAGDHIKLPDWLYSYGRALALLIVLLQLGFSIVLLGLAEGPLLVAVAWIVVGSIFVPCINAWPQSTIQCALLAVVPGSLLLLISAFL